MRNYSNTQFLEAVANSTSISQVIKKLGLIPAGGNYTSFHYLATQLSADTSHFLGQSHNKGKTFGPKRSIEDYLSNNFPINSNRLRIRLLNEGRFEKRCYSCNSSSWLNQDIPLELEHIDGNHANNNFDNLTLLCPNCHALTSTYRGKNISKKS